MVCFIFFYFINILKLNKIILKNFFQLNEKKLYNKKKNICSHILLLRIIIIIIYINYVYYKYFIIFLIL